MKKRIICTLLTLCLMLALIPATAMAEEPGSLLGDINGDGMVTEYDAIMLQNYLAGLETLTGEQLVAADFNGDGRVDYRDLSALQSYLGLQTPTLAVTVSGFRVGNTPADITLSFASTIPGVTFSEDDIQFYKWEALVPTEEGAYYISPLRDNEAFKADMCYRLRLDLDNKGLEEAPAVTVNGKTPEICYIKTSNGQPILITIGCDFGTPEEAYTIIYEFDYGTLPADRQNPETIAEDEAIVFPTLKNCGERKFLGWQIKNSDDIDVYPADAEYYPSENMTFMAVYEEYITLTVSYTTTVKQGGNVAPGETTFDLAIVGSNAGDENISDVTVSGSVTTNGAGDYDGTLTFTGTERSLWRMLSEGAFVQQVNNGKANWTYDDTVWGVLWWGGAAYSNTDSVESTVIVVSTSIDGQGNYYIDRDNLQKEDMTFTNTYTKSVFEPTEPIESDPDLPQTGDNSSMILRTALLLISGSAVIGMIAAGKKRKYN